MTWLDILYIIIALVLVVLAVILGLVSYYLIRILKSARTLIDGLATSISSIAKVENAFKLGVSSILGYVINRLKKGGG